MSQKRLYARPEFWIVVIVALFGAFRLLHKFDISLSLALQNYWPAVFILLGIFQMISARYRDPTAIVLLILAGVILLIIKNDFIEMEEIKEIVPATIWNLLNLVKQALVNAFTSLKFNLGV